MTEKNTRLQTHNPERLSKHDLVNYLIDNPDVRGNFKYGSLLSCMWRNLLIARPGFEDVADFLKINGKDMLKIIDAHPHLADRFEWRKMFHDDQLQLMIKHPELATKERTSSFRGYLWSELLRKHPQLAGLCPFKKLNLYDWSNLVCGQESFAEKCPWHEFNSFDWAYLVRKKKSALKYFKLEHFESGKGLERMLSSCYLGDAPSYQGAFKEQAVEDPATFLIYKRMDKENGRRFLKIQLKKSNWNFVDELCDISCEDAIDVQGKKYIPFYMTLFAPDSVFEKLFPLFDLNCKDPGGNSLLFPALVRGLTGSGMERYNFLLAQGLNADEKNIAGFSCDDVIKQVENIWKKGKTYAR